MKNHLFATLLLALTAGTLRADAITDARPQAVTLGGTTSYDEWTNAGVTAASNPGYPGFPGSGVWPNPIGSNLGDDATLNKTAGGAGGGPYPAGGSIYFGGVSSTVNTNGGQLTVTDSTIAFDINTIVFQVEIGEAWTYDFYNHVLPVLSYTTSGGIFSNISATFASKVVQAYNGTVVMSSGDEPVYVNLWALQWDLSGVVDPITSFSVSLNGVQHSQVYALRLDASSADYSSSILPTAVPEPSTYALGMATLLVIVIVARNRRKRGI